LDRFDGTENLWFQVAKGLENQAFECGGTGNLYNAAMELSERQRKYLRGLGHALKPVLLVGNAGMTPAVIAEAKRALHDHELIKVKFRGAERAARDEGLSTLAASTDSVLVHRIGHTALYYKRRNDRPGIVIPDA
jgi:RNA-binding protein